MSELGVSTGTYPIDGKALLLRLFRRNAAEVEALLQMLPEKALKGEEETDRFFTLPELVVHMMQVTRFALGVVQHDLFGDDMPADEIIARVTSLPPAEAHAELSVLNLGGARGGAHRLTSMSDLRGQWRVSAAQALEAIGALKPAHLAATVRHPMSEHIGDGTCFGFLEEMLVDHVSYHLGQLTLRARQLGYSVPSPLNAAEPARIPVAA